MQGYLLQSDCLHFFWNHYTNQIQTDKRSDCNHRGFCLPVEADHKNPALADLQAGSLAVPEGWESGSPCDFLIAFRLQIRNIWSLMSKLPERKQPVCLPLRPASPCKGALPCAGTVRLRDVRPARGCVSGLLPVVRRQALPMPLFQSPCQPLCTADCLPEQTISEKTPHFSTTHIGGKQ